MSPLTSTITNVITVTAITRVTIVTTILQNYFVIIIGWWFVYKTEGDECGYVPASFLKKLGDPEALMSPTDTRDILGFVFSLTHDQEATPTIAPVLSYTALDNYKTDDTRQLSFPVGAVLTIIEKSEDGKKLSVHLTVAANMGLCL